MISIPLAPSSRLRPRPALGRPRAAQRPYRKSARTFAEPSGHPPRKRERHRSGRCRGWRPAPRATGLRASAPGHPDEGERADGARCAPPHPPSRFASCGGGAPPPAGPPAGRIRTAIRRGSSPRSRSRPRSRSPPPSPLICRLDAVGAGR